MSKPGGEGKEKRRAQRATVERRIKGVFCRIPELSNRDIRILNVSEYGLGIEAAGLSRPPSVGEIYEGRLIVGYTHAPIRVRLVRLHQEFAGMELIEPSDLLRGALRAFFKPELVGASMRPAGREAASLGKIQTLIFKDVDENTLTLEVRDFDILRFQIGILGNSIEWSKEEPIRLIQSDRRLPVDDFLRKQLIKFTHSVENLDPAYRRALELVLLNG